ncbi:hypothetical protein HMPREF0208_04070 [Citrobacter koseri]|uniref:Uncharacterized protein n=1 Tax=Citrobacter koseri (strain ATCC BAA-895 / CDC 4225-83 / SGSC4696) TaxID=290338 RepID=A8ACM4_CITK8|nr:hypothetical protein CKO_00058 [Citrobacter koseri ATCC BAA-895]KXB40755.1 hypothetical protein HMPREF0208_04070 [Citrobacter koseri]
MPLIRRCARCPGLISVAPSGKFDSRMAAKRLIRPAALRARCYHALTR